ncbi:ATP-dependent nuclease [Poriferisphaera sp. WC338]|uniref:ATP-dependent nuclease n=1 Tax=Poriferisphaera sp. WC338 TaxID=3425129 RepID=UPI003D814115
MQVRQLTIKNFRGIKQTTLLLPQHALFIGDNNVGKTTVLEALHLVLGPERLNRFPVINEHDFFEGKYTIATVPTAGEVVSKEEDQQVNGEADQEEAASLEAEGIEVTDAETSKLAPHIEIEAIVIGLSDEQKIMFGSYAEWWDVSTDKLYDESEPEGIDEDNIEQALRVTFIGKYDIEEDDFDGHTYFTRSWLDDEDPTRFGRRHKQSCGFLYLRSLRTGSRALSLERGSLLDIILRLKEVRPQMWEAIIAELSSFSVAADEALGVSGVLESINESLKKYVPREWAAKPHLRVSDLTREHLRKIVTSFIVTGDGDHAAPFMRQGTGTINMLVLAMLSQVAEDKQNVIFAMEEPETAIPPYAQKRIVHEIKNLASQAIFTSHSPYVLEEFDQKETIILSRGSNGVMSQASVELPASIKLKRYRQEFRTRFCEGLLARRVLIAEGATEATCIPTAARRLSELNPDAYSSLEAMGICTVDAGSESNITDMAKLYSELGKQVYAVCDKQNPADKAAIESEVDALFMHEESAIEKLILKESSKKALQRFASTIDWPRHIKQVVTDPMADAEKALEMFFYWSKGNWGIADFLAQCDEDEMPSWIRDTCKSLFELTNPLPIDENAELNAEESANEDLESYAEAQ